MSGSGPQGTTMSLDSNMPYYNEPVSVVMRPTDPGNCFTYDDLATDQNRISTFASTGRFNSTISPNVAGSEKMASKKLVVPRLVVHDMGSLFKYDMVYVNKMNDFVRDTVHMMQEQL
ncbi:hypothetical protein AX774_g1322 [Zancudomyces culisetae]|uniref:Uncharacterized protein n=1 Tax=Zancudomyces culisetae TaxID=1213189 RepID=A0A1R1PVZ4_ZANCU|nr:hypothetical protein AX774_g1322 [Zancudomyces culisetae]|eukprot:OMH85137.1 hypothetical protein AX774_g1322 [Zancudomyces culisetae]